MKLLLPATAALGMLVIGAGFAVMGTLSDDASSTFVVTKVQDKPASAEAIHIPLDALDSFPAAAREGWLQAAREGGASFTLSADEADSYRERMRALAAEQGRLTASYFEFEGQYFRYKNLIA